MEVLGVQADDLARVAAALAADGQVVAGVEQGEVLVLLEDALRRRAGFGSSERVTERGCE